MPQLQAWLTDRGHDVALINAGVSGDTTAGGLSRIDWTLTPEVDALIVALGGNDLLRGIDPANSRANLDDILSRADADALPTLLIGMTAPGNYGPDYKAAFDAMYPELAEAHGALYVQDFLGALQSLGDRTRTVAGLRAGGRHPPECRRRRADRRGARAPCRSADRTRRVAGCTFHWPYPPP